MVKLSGLHNSESSKGHVVPKKTAAVLRAEFGRGGYYIIFYIK